MSLRLTQTTVTQQRIDFEGLLPETLCALSTAEVAAIHIYQGKAQVRLDTLFDIEHQDDGQQVLNLKTIDNNIDNLGKAMATGWIRVSGDIGDYAGRGMSGGRMHIQGNTGSFCGSGLRDGELRVNGNVGDYLGAPSGGETRGQQGGLIHVTGNAGDYAAERQRRGVCLIEGDCGKLAAHRMIAGTLYVGGTAGTLTGHGMRRGSLLLRHAPQSMSTHFRANGIQQLPFLRLLLNDIQRLAEGTLDGIAEAVKAERHLGDVAVDGRGEILILR